MARAGRRNGAAATGVQDRFSEDFHSLCAQKRRYAEI
jgi:hypothetical protein